MWLDPRRAARAPAQFAIVKVHDVDREVEGKVFGRDAAGRIAVFGGFVRRPEDVVNDNTFGGHRGIGPRRKALFKMHELVFSFLLSILCILKDHPNVLQVGVVVRIWGWLQVLREERGSNRRRFVAFVVEERGAALAEFGRTCLAEDATKGTAMSPLAVLA